MHSAYTKSGGNYMFVFPMLGLSNRFKIAGYKVPKYQLVIDSFSVLELVVLSFKKYFDTDLFVFICRNNKAEIDYIVNKLTKLSIKNYELVTIDRETIGQAETVLLGLNKIKNNEEIYVFNIDTIRPKFLKPIFKEEVYGNLEIFYGVGENWSFILPGMNNSVIETAEKKRISNLCSSGLYYFKNNQTYYNAYNQYINEYDKIATECYIAPMYNFIIKEKLTVTYNIINNNEILFCGVPKEYENLKLILNDKIINNIF